MVDKGVNIFSGSNSPIGAALTNWTTKSKEKGKIKHDYPVVIKGVEYPDAEAAYQSLKTKVEKENRLHLMTIIITAKLDQHPKLYEAIKKRGGIEWLARCEHTTWAKSPSMQWWEGQGGDSPMLKCLMDAYFLIETIRSR